MRDATLRDPGYLPAHKRYIAMAVREGRRAEVLARYQRGPREDRELGCFALMAGRPNSGAGSELPRVYAYARQHSVGPCMTLLLAEMVPFGLDVPGIPPTLELRRRAATLAPEIATPWVTLTTELRIRGDSVAADSVLDAALLHVRHPMERVELLSLRAYYAVQRGQVELARERWNALQAAVERDGRPGVLFTYRMHRAQHDPDVVNEAELVDRARLARAGSLGDRFSVATNHAIYLSASGNFARALPHFERSVRIADSMPDMAPRVDARFWLGRALSRMGRAPDAIRVLHDGLALAAHTNLRYTRAELWHNLSHAYESAGDAARAIAASDSFVTTATALDRDPIRIMSLHDAGQLRLNIGWHAAAHASFDAMVRLINTERQNNYWAGEYYERVGNLRAALTFFTRGVQLDAGERSLNLAGLVRVYEALGMPDSVAAAARDHDRYINSITEVPLTPEVLSRAGRHDEALDAARAWASHRETSGNVHGAALARLQVARLALAAGQERAALAEARRAERHARSMRLQSERVEALRLMGIAMSRMPWRRDAALEQLNEAATLALRLGDLRAVRETHLALGIAHGDASRAALAAFEEAARAVERLTSNLDADVDRARYRSTNLAPFDAAIRALRTERLVDKRQFARWSARRKAAALALATHSHRDSASLPVFGALQSSLASDAAIVDYLVLGDSVLAFVVRRDEARIVPLPLTSDTIAALARRMTAQFERRGGRVDLARLAFDESAASRLYQGLVAPLRSALGDARRLTLIPDGVVHHVPFAALGGGGPRDQLLDEFEIDYAPSLAFVGGGAPRSWKGASLLLVRTDVPGATRERDAIRSTWSASGGRIAELANGAATESAVLRGARGADIVHFATHAEANDRQPLATHLRLATNGSSDGMLHLAEIVAARFDRRLVVLAACESTAGELLTGEGFMGLSRAFIAAGAPGVVATRWAVDASAAEFSAVFYRELARGRSPAAATRAAQLALRDQTATAHPFFWAGYVVVRAPGGAR